MKISVDEISTTSFKNSTPNSTGTFQLYMKDSKVMLFIMDKVNPDDREAYNKIEFALPLDTLFALSRAFSDAAHFAKKIHDVVTPPALTTMNGQR